MKQTPLTSWHEQHKAKLIEFHDWLMPVHYGSIIEEYWFVRKQCGLFDISHMGVFEVRGTDADTFLQTVLTNDVSIVAAGHSVYSLLCNEDGGIIDDIIVYKHSASFYTIVVNAANSEKDFLHLASRKAEFQIELKNNTDVVLVSLQGPDSRRILEKLSHNEAAELKYFGFKKMAMADIPVLVARTGYTGELGYEIFYFPESCGDKNITRLWEALHTAGAAPCGLGARDILRLEMKYPLYGNDICLTTNPLEAGLGWAVKLAKDNFIGKHALVKVKKDGPRRALAGIAMRDKYIPRHNQLIFNKAKEKIGRITSGTFSPACEKAIALGYVPLAESKIGNEVAVEIRGQLYPAEIVTTPFVPSHVRD